MARLRTRPSARYKLELALEATEDQKTIYELAGRDKVHPNPIRHWKSGLLDEGHGLFNGQAQSRQHKTRQTRETPLCEQVGRLLMELEWLK
jgi:transposase-like protein